MIHCLHDLIDYAAKVGGTLVLPVESLPREIGDIRLDGLTVKAGLSPQALLVTRMLEPTAVTNLTGIAVHEG